MMDTRIESRRGSLRDPRDAGEARPFPAVPDGCETTLSLSEVIVDQVALGIVVVETDGTIVHANKAALAALEGSGLRISSGAKLEMPDANDAAALAGALTAAAKQRRTLIALGNERCRLTIAVQPLRSAGGNDRQSLAMLLFSKVVLCDPAALAAYARAHQLTPAEKAVVDALCSGLRAKEVALRTRSSVATVRSHLRNIYCKTGARNLQDLLARVATLPPLAGSD